MDGNAIDSQAFISMDGHQVKKVILPLWNWEMFRIPTQMLHEIHGAYL